MAAKKTKAQILEEQLADFESSRNPDAVAFARHMATDGNRAIAEIEAAEDLDPDATDKALTAPTPKTIAPTEQTVPQAAKTPAATPTPIPVAQKPVPVPSKAFIPPQATASPEKPGETGTLPAGTISALPVTMKMGDAPTQPSTSTMTALPVAMQKMVETQPAVENGAPAPAEEPEQNVVASEPGAGMVGAQNAGPTVIANTQARLPGGADPGEYKPIGRGTLEAPAGAIADLNTLIDKADQVHEFISVPIPKGQDAEQYGRELTAALSQRFGDTRGYGVIQDEKGLLFHVTPKDGPAPSGGKKPADARYNDNLTQAMGPHNAAKGQADQLENNARAQRNALAKKSVRLYGLLTEAEKQIKEQDDAMFFARDPKGSGVQAQNRRLVIATIQQNRARASAAKSQIEAQLEQTRQGEAQAEAMDAEVGRLRETLPTLRNEAEADAREATAGDLRTMTNDAKRQEREDRSQTAYENKLMLDEIDAEIEQANEAGDFTLKQELVAKRIALMKRMTEDLKKARGYDKEPAADSAAPAPGAKTEAGKKGAKLSPREERGKAHVESVTKGNPQWTSGHMMAYRDVKRQFKERGAAMNWHDQSLAVFVVLKNMPLGGKKEAAKKKQQQDRSMDRPGIVWTGK